MKKLIAVSTLCLAVLLAAGCQARRQGDVTGEGAPVIPGAGRDSVPESAPPQNEPLFDAVPYVADAPMYRGTVAKLEEEGGRLTLKLESPEGADFGYSNIMMQTGEETRAGFSLQEIQVGDHLEVYFRDRTDGQPPLILSATKLPPAADTVYNGEVVRYEEAAGRFVLELRPLAGGDTTIFTIGEDTRLYLEEALLVPGERVNVYHRGILTKSIPPQGQALEIRPYHAPAAG